MGAPRAGTATDTASLGLEDLVSSLQQKLEEHGAPASAVRVSFVHAHIDHLSAEAVYSLVDRNKVNAEVESSVGRRARIIFIVRNLFALFPLLFTWVAFAQAAALYQQQIARDPRSVNLPFLELWQTGFGGTTPFTFSAAAWIDFVLIAAVVLLTLGAHVADYHANQTIQEVLHQLDLALAQLADTAIQRPLAGVGMDPMRWANAVRRVIDDAMKKTATLAETLTEGNKQLVMSTAYQMQGIVDRFDAMSGQMTTRIESSLQAIVDANKAIMDQASDRLDALQQAGERRAADIAHSAEQVLQGIATQNEDLIRGQMAPLVNDFRVQVTDFVRELSKYEQHTDALTQGSSELGKASAILASNVGAYTDSANAIKQHVEALNANMRSYIDEVVRTQAGYAEHVASAAKDISRTAGTLGTVTDKLSSGMVAHLDDTSRELGEVGQRLSAAGATLAAATAELSQVNERLRFTTQQLAGAAANLREMSKKKSGRWWPFGG